MADKQITELPASSGVTNETQFPAYQPGSLTPAQKVSGAQIAAFAEAAGEAAASDLQRGATFTPDYDPDTGILSWTNDSNLPNPEPEVVGGVSSFKGRTGAVVPQKGDYTPDMVGAATRPNLLDNWCFLPGYVVNQRGKTSYTAVGYTIDRLYNRTANTQIDMLENGLKITQVTAAGSNKNQFVNQRINNYAALLGKKVTLSFLIAENTLSKGCLIRLNGANSVSTNTLSLGETSYTKGTGLYSATFSIPNSISYSGMNVALILNETNDINGYAVIAAMKLELGDTQTLAHQDADGNWVLNEYPDYNEQLLRCCMSTADSSDTYANNKRTPAAIGAVNKAGDTMTGNLSVSKSSYPQISVVDTTQARKAMIEYSSRGVVSIQNRSTDDDTNYSSIWLDRESSELETLLRVGQVKSGTRTTYNVLHTGNKPTGTYTGNGSATSRTIDTGGLGSVCVITSSKGNCIVLTNGAFYWLGSTTGAVAAGVCKFTDGVLTLATALDAFNANGITYTYQVL